MHECPFLAHISIHQVASAKYAIDMGTQLEVLNIYHLPSPLHNTLSVPSLLACHVVFGPP